MTQQYCLASVTAWLSSTGISHHNLLPHIPLIHLSSVNSSPCPEIAPQSLNPSSQPLHLPEDLRPCPGYVWLQQGQSYSHSIYCHRSAVSLLALNVSPLTQTIAPMWGLPLCFSSSTCQGQVQSYWHSYFFPPSSFILPSFVWVFFTGQVLLSTLSWCSACTSVSEGVFLMYPWREMYSMSTYSPAVLFSARLYS